MSFLETLVKKEFKRNIGLAIDLMEYSGTGVCIAFFLDPEVARQVALSIPNAEPPEDLHITMLYLGKRENMTSEDIRLIADVVSKISRDYGVLYGTLGGIGRFSASNSTDSKDVFYLSVNVPNLQLMQVDLVQRLEQLGVPCHQRNGFTPHVTLGYIARGEKNPITRFEPLQITLSSLSLTVGSGNQNREDFPLLLN